MPRHFLLSYILLGLLIVPFHAAFAADAESVSSSKTPENLQAGIDLPEFPGDFSTCQFNGDLSEEEEEIEKALQEREQLPAFLLTFPDNFALLAQLVPVDPDKVVDVRTVRADGVVA